MNSRYTAEEVIAAYQATGSVWAAGKKLGLSGQSVHERLHAIGYPLASRLWTEHEIDEMQALMDKGVPMGEIANRLGRPYAGVACKASELGIKHQAKRSRKIPRGVGLDKVSTLRHMKALERSSARITQYARTHSFHVDTLVMAFQAYCPEQWDAYVSTHSNIPRGTCEYCGREFVPFTKKQKFCDRKCGADARTDKNYFGGKRRNTIGLAEQVCQLCERQGVKGLSSHHVFGKENDPDNNVLIALCQGCHNLVTLLGGRTFVDNAVAWESLISLAWLRRHGSDAADGELGNTLHVTVEIEHYNEGDIP